MKKKILSVLLALTMLTVPAVADTNAEAPLSITAEAATKLAKPTSVQGTVKDGKITLSWKKVKGAEAYGVYKYNTKTKKYTKVKITTKTKITINVNGKAGTYKYRIYSLDKVDGKYKKGEYAYKKVTVKRDYAREFIDGSKFGISKKEFLALFSKYEITAEADDGYDLLLSDGTVISGLFENNKLTCIGAAYKYSESKKKELTTLLESNDWEKDTYGLAESVLGYDAEMYLSPDGDSYALVFRFNEAYGEQIAIAFYDM